jgi:hypothetical protein
MIAVLQRALLGFFMALITSGTTTSLHKKTKDAVVSFSLDEYFQIRGSKMRWLGAYRM